jgi:predicted house-cleaning noncanonical NTP pyrophosphatase (MazG superfamily)
LASVPARPPDLEKSLRCTALKDIHKQLRRIASWVNSFADRRSHLEWCVGGETLWLVQLDFEEEDELGVDPRICPTANPPVNSENGGALFTRYAISAATPWKKLNNLNDFDVHEQKPRHVLYFCRADLIEHGVRSSAERSELVAEITRLTNSRSVTRTDTTSPTIPAYNLPRTETLDGDDAVKWLEMQIDLIMVKKVELDQFCFILHQFIPARAAAWSYFKQNEAIVTIDALWGLPDALQFCPHDSYQIDLRVNRVVSRKIRFKPQFLKEIEDGSWQYVSINRKFARYSTLSDKALVYIAKETELIARKISEDAQIMWFCDIPLEQGLGDHLPWFRTKQFADKAQIIRRQFQIISVNNFADLEKLNDSAQDFSKCAIQLIPDANLIRDECFLARVIEVAKQYNLPVELAGSTLGHAFYQLQQSGVVVYCADPFSGYERVRQRKVFEKLVRDDIPAQIASKGERVVQSAITAGDAPKALLAKLIEEALEFSRAQQNAERREELADIYEVLQSIATVSGLRFSEIVSEAEIKRQKRGGFDRLISGLFRCPR